MFGMSHDSPISRSVALIRQDKNLMAENEVRTMTSVWNNYTLHCYVWQPSETPRGMLYISHGVTEHMGRYDQLASHLAKNGVFVFGHDHVGHGESEGERVHVENVDIYVQDVIHHVEQMKKEHPNLPCILLGHSMGGLIAAHVSIQRQDLFLGLILSAAAVRPIAVGKMLSFFTKFAVKSLAYIMPKVPMFPWSTRHISSMPEEVKYYEEDSLTHCGMMKPGWAAAMMDSMESLQSNLHQISLPLLILHGIEDGLVQYSSSVFVYGAVSSVDKTFLNFQGYHEIFHDVDQDKAKHSTLDWILAILAP